MKIINFVLGFGIGILFLCQAFGIINLNQYQMKDASQIDQAIFNMFFSLSLTASIGFFLGIINLVETSIIKKIAYYRFGYELLEIIHATKLPKKLPKVVYVYTSHNDFIPARMLQNMKQTYQNIEYWISDGSDNEQVRKIVKDFAKKHHVNLFQFPKTSGGSKNKADNLNTFLKDSGVKFDYLLIADADEVIHPNFVACAIPFFFSKKFRNLEAVSPLNQTYRSKGVYTNSMRCLDDSYWYLYHQFKTISFSQCAPITSCSSLISHKFLKEVNNFPEGCLEDWYLEAEVIEHNAYTLTFPLTICYQEYDTSIKAHYARITRINDWIVRWFKTNSKERITKYNEKYTRWYRSYFRIVIFFPIVLLAFALICFLLWATIYFWNDVSKLTVFWVLLGSGGALIIISILIRTIQTWGIEKFVDSFWFTINFILYIFSSTVVLTIHWFKAVVFSIYPVFGGSIKQGSLVMTKRKTKSNIYWWIALVISASILVSFNVCYFLFLNNTYQFLPLVIVVNVILGWYTIGIFSYLFLYYINFIPSNHSYCQNDFLDFAKYKDLFKKPKKQFYENHKDLKPVC